MRLKSGDAGVFGRLEEEIEALRAAGIGYEIIPGVTAACAAGAARRHSADAAAHRAPRPVHHRRRCERRIAARICNWAALADPHAMTAVYMGKRTFPALAAKLIAQGLSPDTPALLAESVGQADQRLVRTTVEKLAEQLDTGKCHGDRRDPLRGAGGGRSIAI